MPLIILTGYPSSGKTHRANQIQTEFETRIANLPQTTTKHKVITIPAHHASLDAGPTVTNQTTIDASANPRDQIYNLASAEKVARAEEFSAIKRALNKNDIVIADSLNYIKGFRYQLWCEAKAAATRCVVVHVAAREDECENWNKQRTEAWGWEFPDEQEQVHAVNATNTQGDLEPASHTALYGDKMGSDARSRSSSMDGAASDEEPRSRADDNLTLKSLYISAEKPSSNRHEVHLLQHSQPQTPITLPDARSAYPYSPATLRSLVMRYEPPSPFTRWDTPLFTVPSADTHPPYESIWTALFPSKVPPKKTSHTSQPATPTPDTQVRQHAATVLPKATSSNALQVLESATADVVKVLLGTAKEKNQAGGDGGELGFEVSCPPSDNVGLSIMLPETPLSQPMLQRLRRKYTQIQRGGIAHGQGHVSGREEVIRSFTTFLAMEWGTNE